MSPITSFTASLGHNGLIDVFAVSNPDNIDSTVWRARQKTPGGHWAAWANEGKPGRGAGSVQSVLDAEKHGHVLAVTDAAQLWFKERTPTDALSAWKPIGGPAVKPAEIADPVPNDAWLFLAVWAGVHADGRIELAGTANDIGDSRDVFYRARPAGSTTWGTWYPLGDNGFDGALVAAIARDGGLEIITPVDAFPGPGQEEIGMQHKRRHPDGTWTSWSRLRPASGRVQRRHLSRADRRPERRPGAVRDIGSRDGLARLPARGRHLVGVGAPGRCRRAGHRYRRRRQRRRRTGPVRRPGRQHSRPLPPGRPGRPVDGLDAPGRPGRRRSPGPRSSSTPRTA